MGRIKITGTGSFLPEKVITNDELAVLLPQTSDEWIFSHTGISSRHLACDADSPMSMGVAAGKRALEMSGLKPEDLGGIIVSTSTPDYAPVPPISCLIQNELGIKNKFAFDVSAGCCGFVYGLEVARGLMMLHKKPILLISTEMMSRMIDWNDYKTCVLFGDGAGAVVLEYSEDESSGIIDSFLKADGSGADLLKIEGGCHTPESHFSKNAHILQMDGKKVFVFAIKALPEVVLRLLERNNLRSEDIDKIIPHQANYRIIRSAATRLGFTEDRFFINVQHVANTASASVPIALDEMNRKNLLKKGDRLLTVSFGAGLTFGGNLIIW